jgi:Fe-S-cluster containining protein
MEHKFKNGECKRCGQCCRMIHMSLESHRRIQSDDSSGGDLAFCRNNWQYVGKSLDVSGAFISPREDGMEEYYIYRCSLLGPDNKCSIHDRKPRVCSGYPFYEGATIFDSTPWPYKGCVHEWAYSVGILYQALCLIRTKKREEMGEPDITKEDVLVKS